MDLSGLQQVRKDNERSALEIKRHADLVQGNIDIQETVVKAFNTLVNYLDGHVTKTEVLNQLKSISTPDIAYVVDAVNSLENTVQNKNLDLSEVTELLKGVLEQTQAIPKDLPETPKQEFVDYTELLNTLTEKVEKVVEAVKSQETHVEAPVVNVPETVVNVPETDLKPLEKGLEKVEKAVKAVKIPEVPKTDLSKVEKEQTKQTKLLAELLDKPVGGGGGGSSWVAVNPEGIAQPLAVDDTGSLQINAASWGCNDMSDPYYGFTNSSGGWQIKKVTATSVSYATVSNNGTVTTYTDAWANKATLNFGRFDEA